LPACPIAPMEYSAVPVIVTSDHTPVRAAFEVAVKQLPASALVAARGDSLADLSIEAAHLVKTEALTTASGQPATERGTGADISVATAVSTSCDADTVSRVHTVHEIGAREAGATAGSANVLSNGDAAGSAALAANVHLPNLIAALTSCSSSDLQSAVSASAQTENLEQRSTKDSHASEVKGDMELIRGHSLGSVTGPGRMLENFSLPEPPSAVAPAFDALTLRLIDAEFEPSELGAHTLHSNAPAAPPSTTLGSTQAEAQPRNARGMTRSRRAQTSLPILSLSFHGQMLDQREADRAAEARAWMASSARGAPIRFEPTTQLVHTFAVAPKQLTEQAVLIAMRVGGRARRDGDVSANSSGTLLGQGAITLAGLMPRIPLPFRVTLLRHGLPVGVLSGMLQLCNSEGRPLQTKG